MRPPDFSRSDIYLFTFLTGLACLIAGVWASPTFLATPGTGAVFTGLVGVAVGGAISFVATTYHDRRRRARELADLKASIYAEVADRAARCLSDYLEPWRKAEGGSLNGMTAERLGKFRPADPVVYPAIAPKLGLLEPKTLLALNHFYFRLDALSRAIDALTALLERREKPGALPIVEQQDPSRLKLVASRMVSCFEPALRALEALAVPGAAGFDQEAAREYRHLSVSGDTLRTALKSFASKDR